MNNKFMKFIKALLAFAITFGFVNQASGNDEPKLILIHLDAASTHYVQQEMKKGNLPNLESYFGEHGRIDYTITYFPSKTPTVISSLRFGDTVRSANLPGWEWVVDTTEGPVVRTVGTFLQMVFSKSRLSTPNIIYGVSMLNWMAGPALLNTADYLKDYNVLQFYWYNVDTQGHFNGEAAYLKELAEFDRQFGRLVKRLPDDVNIIIYADHGMKFDNGIEITPVIEDLVEDDLAVYSYPSLYLENGVDADYYAKRVLEETDIDFTFFRLNETRVKGYHKESKIIFTKNYDDITLNYEYSGADVLGYYEKGYNGEFLTREEWLSFTHKFHYPLTPVILFHHFDNPAAADVITLFDETKFPKTNYASSGNHGGFTYLDMTVPVFVRGPDVESLYNREYYWLPNLFQDFDHIDFEQYPPRDRHYVASRYDFWKNRTETDLVFSPKYRIKYGATAFQSDFNNLSSFDRVDIFGMGDVFRSYLTRVWLGTGVEIQNSEIKPLFIFQYDIHIRRFVFHNSFATNRPFRFHASYEVRPWLAFELVNFSSVGFRFDF
jgi:hypothetical protein